MHYIDSNVFIYAVISDELSEQKAAHSKKILYRIADGSLEAATSVLTWDELVWIVRKLSTPETAQKEGRQFLEFPNLKLLQIDAKTLEKAQSMIERYSLKPRDAMHIACAIQNNITHIISDDGDFDKITEITRKPLAVAATDSR